MSKYMRHQSIISRHSESYIDEDNWIHKLEQSMQKEAVQPRSVDKSVFEQISAIMNNKSKYPSVQAAVDDMKSRSGLTAYLDKMSKTSTQEETTRKIAADQNNVVNKTVKLQPIVMKKCPKIADTVRNYVESTRGNLPVPAIIQKIRSIHEGDVSEASDWEDDNLVRYVSKLNLLEKSKNRFDDHGYDHLGQRDDSNDSDIDPSNVDAFNALNPVKF